MKKLILITILTLGLICCKKQTTTPVIPVTPAPQFGTLIFKSVCRYSAKNIPIYHYFGFATAPFNSVFNDGWNYSTGGNGSHTWTSNDSIYESRIDTIKVNIAYATYWANRITVGKGNMTIGGPYYDYIFHSGTTNLVPNGTVMITDTILWN